jgi:hypothetical protein
VVLIAHRKGDRGGFDQQNGTFGGQRHTSTFVKASATYVPWIGS